MTSSDARGSSRLFLVLAFFAIYFVWGSTYLAIRYAVETIPPLLTAGLRHLVAGSVLFFWSRLAGHRVTAAEWRASLVVGALFFLIGHGTLHWAEQVVPSGLAALLIATEPIWIAVIITWWGERVRPDLRTVLGLAIGLIGVAVLMGSDVVAAGGPEVFWGSALVLVGALSWAAGIGYSARATLPRDPITRTATTLLAGSGLLLVSSTITGEPMGLDPAQVTVRSVLGLGYLIVFGSIVAFTAYMWLLQRCSATLVATHTYVNPIVAVLLGWLLAGEPLNSRILISAGLILGAVGLINAGVKRAARPAPGAVAAEAEPSM